MITNEFGQNAEQLQVPSGHSRYTSRHGAQAASGLGSGRHIALVSHSEGDLYRLKALLADFECVLTVVRLSQAAAVTLADRLSMLEDL